MNDNELYNDIRKEAESSINFIDGTEYKANLRVVCDIAADIVTRTLGPYASTTLLDNGVDEYSTKDGWTVLDHLIFADPIQSTLYNYIKRISFALNSRVGDGTTTALVVSRHFIHNFEALKELLKENNVKYRQADMLDRVEGLKNKIIEGLKSPGHLHMIDSDGDLNEIYNIAYVSSNRNDIVSKMIHEIYTKTKNPNIHVTLSDTEQSHYEINMGYRLDCRLLWSQLFLQDSKEMIIPDGANVYVFDHNIKFSEHFALINGIVNHAKKDGKIAVILAPNYDDQFLSAMGTGIKTALRDAGSSLIILMQLSLTNQALRNYAMDFAAITNTEVFSYTKVRMFNFISRYRENPNATIEEITDSEEFQAMFPGEYFQKPEEIIAGCTGYAPRLVLTEKYALIEEYSKESKMYKAVLKTIADDYENAKEKIRLHGSITDRDYLEAHLRYVKFMGDTGIIYVGGDSELKKQCLKDAIVDATLACRSAYENGYIRGFNIETLSVISEILQEYDPSKLGKVYTTEEYMDFEIAEVIGRSFAAASRDVMNNKFVDDDVNPSKYTWDCADVIKDEIDTPHKYAFTTLLTDSSCNWSEDELNNNVIIAHCIDNNECFDLVTEKFETAGETVTNSVSTDIEILNAVTSIITMLLSSNQLLSISKRYDKAANKRKILESRTEDSYAMMKGIVDAFKDSEVQIPVDLIR